jgi:uncharacterized protein YaaQ
MKMIIAIVRDKDDECITGRLVDQGYGVTRLASTGGFLKRGNTTLLIGVEDAEQVEAVVELLRETCSPPDPDHHCATLFVVETQHFEQV